MYGNVNRKKHPDGGYYKDYFYYACKHRNLVNGHCCDYKKQWIEDKIDDVFEEVIRRLLNNTKWYYVKKKYKLKEKMYIKLEFLRGVQKICSIKSYALK